MKCPNCQTENPDAATFCNKCGAKLEARQVQTPPPAEKKKRGRGKTLIIVAGGAIGLCIVVAIIAALAGGGGGGTPTPVSQVGQPAATAPAEATSEPATVQPADTPTSLPPTDTPTSLPPTEPPTDTPIPQPTDTPVPVEPVVFLELQGTGEIVSDNFNAPECYKAVFSWSAKANSSGMAALIVNLHNADSGTKYTLVNALVADTKEATGDVLKPLEDGKYFISTENVTGDWSVRGTCFDGQAPVGEGIDLQGQGQTVTQNVSLPNCAKSVFHWSVVPNSGGTAALILTLHEAQAGLSVNLANELEFNNTAPLEGQAVQSVPAGAYFLVLDNATGPWSVKWECQD